MRVITIASIALAVTACDTEGRFSELGQQAVGNQPEAPRIYEFVEHGPAVEFQRPHEEEPQPSCVTTCIADWQAKHDACAGDSPLEDGAACRVAAHEATAVCIDILCAAEREAREPGTCAADCDAEARQVGQQCVEQHGYDDRCLSEADAVFATCWEAECDREVIFDDSQVGQGPTAAHEDTGYAAEEASTPAPKFDTDDAEMTCAEKCKAYDVSMYIKCVNTPHTDVDGCRNDVGLHEHVCLVEHCPAGTDPVE
jgi:hypothetical protein